MASEPPTAQDIIQSLNLQPHIEGGFFRRTYQSSQRDQISTPNGPRFLLTSIFYLIVADGVLEWNLNQSDILHYFQLGDPIEYSLIHPDGTLQVVIMGPDILNGQQLQLHVKGGVWKRSHLLDGSKGSNGYGLVSEAVSPGFDYEDMKISSSEELQAKFPQHADALIAISRQSES